jgi:hypothetical protein
MEIHHLVLKRQDGSVLRQDFCGAPGPAPQISCMVEVAVRRSVRVPARVSVVETSSAATRGNAASRLKAQTVPAHKLLCVPVAQNDP